MNTLWLIPARGGSKGIPNKNIKPFCGISLVNRAVLQALECAHSQDTVFVSTDSEQIRFEVEKTGVKVPFLRPAELAQDSSSTYSVIMHVLKVLQKQNLTFEKIVLLQPTSPFRENEDIKEAVRLWNSEIDMVVSVCLSSANPYYNLFQINEEGYLRICMGDGNFIRRQDAPKVWEYNGAIYVMTVSSLLKGQMSGFSKIIPYEMPASRSIDLDTPQDWIIAESLFNHRKK